jgi:hypothetical protein
MATGMTRKNFLKFWVSKKPPLFLKNKSNKKDATTPLRPNIFLIYILTSMHKVDFLPDQAVDEEIIKKTLIKFSLE